MSKKEEEEASTASFKEMQAEEKRAKISSNYETIEVLRNRLEESQKRAKVGMTRSAYIRMIFDATKKVDKQNQELTKAVVDVRQLQRDIRSLNGRLDQNFRMAEETIRKWTKNDAWAQECYVLLRVIHKSCDQLVQFVQYTGDLTRELRQLEDQLGQAKIQRSIDMM